MSNDYRNHALLDGAIMLTWAPPDEWEEGEPRHALLTVRGKDHDLGPDDCRALIHALRQALAEMAPVPAASDDAEPAPQGGGEE